MEAWYLFETGADAAAVNMAYDEVLLETAVERGGPTLRFYSWLEPAASFGYFQKFSEIEQVTALRPLVRRPTGGGLVPHDADWTYSLTVPPGHWWYELSAQESYRNVHVWLQAAFTRMNVETEVASCCRKEVPGQCFQGYEQYDLLRNGRKIAGAAQRRNRSGLLIQGSIQPPPNLVREAWEKHLQAAASEQWEVRWATCPWTLEQGQLTRHLMREKYSRPDYNQKR